LPGSLRNAEWIASPCAGGPRTSAPAAYFRKAFQIDRPVKSAVLTATALGLYECEFNGQRVGDEVFAPGWTDYRRRVQSDTYDVSALLRRGENVLGAILGDGWYCGFVGWGNRQVYGDRPRLLARLHVVFEDDASVVVVTDGSWKTSPGPILENDLLMGETYDARLELGKWSEPGYDDSFWIAARRSDPDSVPEIHPRISPPVRRIGEITPVSRNDIDSSNSATCRHVYDMGQNFAGRVRIKARAAAGTMIRIVFAEMLNPDGTFYTENLRGARATDFYICRGGGDETWEPRFTFHGFRYVELSGFGLEDAAEPTGIVLHSDLRPIGTFRCSNPLLNQLQHNIEWGQKSNFLEVPTDCPQRDERLGWTGDAQVFIRTACFNMDVRDFFHKWMRDIRDAQTSDGGIPAVIPNHHFLNGPADEDGGPAWSDAVIICPWTIYLCYADRQILEENYEAMRRFMEFIATHRCLRKIRSHPRVDPWGGFGDWLALDGGAALEGLTTRDLIGTAFYAYDAGIMARVAAILGRQAEAEQYAGLAEEIRQAFQRRFITPEGLVMPGTQTAYVLALHFDLLPKSQRETAASELVRLIEKNHWHLATGFVGTPYLLDVLEASGHLDAAYKLLEQESYPSWLFPIKNGATTIWERWDGWTPEKGFQNKMMNSFNHYAYGAVGAWMYRSVAGLDLDPDEPGYRHIIFRPRPGGSLTWAEAALETPYGCARIRWDRDGINRLNLALEIPETCRCTVKPPPNYRVERTAYGPGTHCIQLSREL